MNESIDSSEVQAPSPFLPLLLVELSVLLFLVFLNVDQTAQRSKLQGAFNQRETLVQQSAQVQTKLQKLTQDFATAAPNEAQAVFAKYGIQFNQQAASPSPTP